MQLTAAVFGMILTSALLVGLLYLFVFMIHLHGWPDWSW